MKNRFYFKTQRIIHKYIIFPESIYRDTHEYARKVGVIRNLYELWSITIRVSAFDSWPYKILYMHLVSKIWHWRKHINVHHIIKYACDYANKLISPRFDHLFKLLINVFFAGEWNVINVQWRVDRILKILM